MADVKIPYPEAGLAAFEALDTWSADLLISGSWPELQPGVTFIVTADEVLTQFQVVGLTAGKLVPATTTVTPIGIMSQSVTGNAGGTTTVSVLMSGCFNPDMLGWDATFATDALKANAFMGAPSPTQILIRSRA
jgi:hypothetical protein